MDFKSGIIGLTLDSEQCLQFKQEVQEPYDIFLLRVKFCLQALIIDISTEQSLALSFVYRNKLLYKVTYQEDIEKMIDKILSVNLED